MTPEQKDSLEQMINDCVDTARCSNHHFSKWDIDFIASINIQWEQKKFLTPKQRDILIKIWEKI